MTRALGAVVIAIVATIYASGIAPSTARDGMSTIAPRACAQPESVAPVPDRLATIRTRGHLIVATKNEGARARTAHRDPAHTQKRNFELRIAHAIAAALLGKSDQLEIKILRKPERIPAVVAGTVDLAIAMLDSSRATDEVDYSQPYYRDGLALMQAAAAPTLTLKDLPRYRVLGLHRDPYGEAIDAARLQSALGLTLPLLPVEDFGAAAAQIRGKQADALLSMAANIDAYLADDGVGLKRSPVLLPVAFAIAMPKHNPALLQAVNAVVAELETSGQLYAWAQEAGLAEAQK